MKVLYLVSIERRTNRSNPTGRINGWKGILNTLTIHYHDRIRGHELAPTIPVTHTRSSPLCPTGDGSCAVVGPGFRW